MFKSKFSRLITILAVSTLSLTAQAADNDLLTTAKTMDAKERTACVPNGYGWGVDLTKVEDIRLRNSLVILEFDKMATMAFSFNTEEMANDVYINLLRYQEACSRIQLEKAVENAKRTLREHDSKKVKPSL